MTAIAIAGVAAVVLSYACCKISHKEDEIRRYENNDCGIWDEW